MHPLPGLRLPSATGGDDGQMGVVLAIAAMRLDHHDVATLERGATDPTEDIVSAPDPTTHEGTQYHSGMLIKRLPEYLGHGQDDMPVDDALMQHLAALADPVVDRDFGTAQAQRRFTAHRDEMCALATVETAVFDKAYLLGLPAPEHLLHEAIIVARIVARVDVFEPVPVLSKDLFEDVPVLGGCCKHQGAPSGGSGFAMPLLYHGLSAQSTPSSAFTEAPSPTSLTLQPRGLQGNP